MLVTFATIGLLVWLIVCGIFLGLIPDAAQPENAVKATGEREHAPVMASAQSHAVPVELLVYRLEDYIRAEEAAAETYLLEPSPHTLHAGSRNISVN